MLIWGVMVLLPDAVVVGQLVQVRRGDLPEPVALPAVWHWDNFVRAWNQSNIGAYFLNSVIVVSAPASLTLLLSSAVAYVLAQFGFSGSRALYYLFVGGMVFPGFLALVPLFFVVQNLGLLNTYARPDPRLRHAGDVVLGVLPDRVLPDPVEGAWPRPRWSTVPGTGVCCSGSCCRWPGRDWSASASSSSSGCGTSTCCRWC